MNFDGKTLIIIGSLFFIFQLANFFSIESITPELERAQVLSAITSVIIILIGFLFKRFNPINSEKVNLEGENEFYFDSKIPKDVLNEFPKIKSICSLVDEHPDVVEWMSRTYPKNYPRGSFE